ncbi:thiol-activated cytolysin family protein [Paracraurococcus ruber]|uniref:thiol-activated cytolysin family protein n=1 Tax=Paracraurococcus ruber TaxID=77675 RepID=UPI00130522EC|nr:thiol-activated cytolysin family protein [Paracraurococcus ruber]
MVDRLKAGEKLSLGEKLVSPNGRFTLWMQPDNNLVLYQGAFEASNAYWATMTLWLPEQQRPITAEMQADAHFVLYDKDRAPRWASGTWGPSFVDPYLVLQDDGNLVIYHHVNRPVWASGGVGGVGRLPAIGFVPGAPDLETAVDQCGRLPAVVAGSTDLAPPSQSTVDVAGVAYIVTEQRRRLVNDVVEQAFLQDIASMGIWPGLPLQGKALLNGDIAPIGPLSRQPGTINVTDVISNTPHQQSAKVQDPAAASVNAARLQILQSLNPSDSPGIIKSGFERASTLREVGVKLGVTVKGSAFGVDANATLDQTRRQSTVVASIRQIFYSVNFTPEGARARGIWRPDIDWDALAPFMGPGNPPLYVDSVQYGRFICATVQGAFSSTEITGALKVHWSATVSGNVDFDARTKEVLENSQVKIYTIGVPGRQNFQDLADPLADLRDVYKAGLSFSLANPGMPISFTCRHITDGTLAHVGLAAEFIQPLSVQGQDVIDRPFEVFDGPGGGLVDTGIRVNPGDQVSVRAEGQIWSGVIFSQPHGPEGWPGHTADSAAPLPSATAYAFIIRFGNGKWIEAGPLWDGTPPPNNSGVLQLHVNDNNPYNGDPHKRWKVKVNVKRAAAGASGIFV